METHEVVSMKDWLAASKALLAKEKAFTRAHDALSRQRRELPCDLLPKGRDENGPNYNLMDWVKRHDMYEDGRSSDATAQHQSAGQTHECCSAAEQRS